MNRNRQGKKVDHTKKICAAGLTAALAIGVGVSGLSYTGTTRENKVTYTNTAEVAAAGNTAKDTKTTSSNSLFKDEAVYVLADPSGAISDITVADWLKNAGGLGSIQDTSSLTDIVNTKGDEKFTQNGDTLTWDGADEDIYYQGKSSNDLPVSVAFTYKLDGQEMEPADLAGKSGSLEIQIKYKNNTKEKTTVGGKGAELCTPFAMATALLLPTDTFANVQVDNGKIVSDGDKIVVVGYGMPGVKDSLDLSEDLGVDIPDTVTLTADVTDFEMGSTLTYASSNLLSDLNVDDIYDTDSLKKDLDDLKDASKLLVDGSGDLTDGVKELKDKSGDFTDGIDTLVDGLKEFSKGVSTLKTGVTDYTTGVNTLVNGVNTYVNGANTLCDGITSYTNGADQLVAGVNTLGSSLSELPSKLTQLSNGYSSVMNGINQLASKDNMTALTNGATSLSNGITSVNGGLTQIQGGINTVNSTLAQLEASFANNEKCIEALNGALAAMPDGASKTQLQGVVTNLKKVTDTQKSTIAQLKAATAKDSALGKGVSTLVTTTGSKGELKGGAEKLKTGITNFSAGASKLQAALPQLQTGTNQLVGAVDKLPSAIAKLTTGANKLGANSKTLRAGATKLKSSGTQLTTGGKKLTSNSAALVSGVNKLDGASDKLISGGGKLSDGATKLTDGVNKLYDGSVELHDGMVKFDKEGISKLYDTVNDDLQGVLDRLKALKKLGDNYKSFSGKSDSMDGSVKFIIKTDEIKNADSNDDTTDSIQN